MVDMACPTCGNMFRDIPCRACKGNVKGYICSKCGTRINNPAWLGSIHQWLKSDSLVKMEEDVVDAVH